MRKRVFLGIFYLFLITSIVVSGSVWVSTQVRVTKLDIRSVDKDMKTRIRASHEKAIKYVFKGEGAFSGLSDLRLSVRKSMEYGGTKFSGDIPVYDYVNVESGAFVYESRVMVGYDIYYVMSSVYPNGREYIRGGIIHYER